MKAIVKVAVGVAAAAACGVAVATVASNDKRVKAGLLKAKARVLELAADAEDIAIGAREAAKANLRGAKSDFDDFFTLRPDEWDAIFDFKKNK